MEWINSKEHIIRYDFSDMLNWSSAKLKQAYFDLHEAIRNRYAVDSIEAESIMLSIITELERRGNGVSEVSLLYKQNRQLYDEINQISKYTTDFINDYCDEINRQLEAKIQESQETH